MNIKKYTYEYIIIYLKMHKTTYIEQKNISRKVYNFYTEKKCS